MITLPRTLALVLGATLLGAVGCAPRPAPPVELDDPAIVLDHLALIARPAFDDTYRRAAFGTAWADVDGNSCRQRADALFRDVDRSAPFRVQTRGDCAHDVLAGTWDDPYTGERRTFTDLKDPRQAQAIPIDHRVSLLNAWRHGARDWSDDRRLRFANDLDNLQPTTAHANQSKGGDDAAAWRPRQEVQCDFATRYVVIKARWSLSVDPPEKAALAEMLRRCP